MKIGDLEDPVAGENLGRSRPGVDPMIASKTGSRLAKAIFTKMNGKGRPVEGQFAVKSIRHFHG